MRIRLFVFVSGSLLLGSALAVAAQAGICFGSECYAAFQR